MPTPVKYNSPALRESYRLIEQEAAGTLLSHLPEQYRADFEPLVREEWDADILKLVKAADKLAAYALMAAGGDFGASIAPQLMGIVVDKVSVSTFAVELSSSTGMTVEEIGLKVGMLIAAIFPVLGTVVVMYIRKVYKKKA